MVDFVEVILKLFGQSKLRLKRVLKVLNVWQVLSLIVVVNVLEKMNVPEGGLDRLRFFRWGLRINEASAEIRKFDLLSLSGPNRETVIS